MIRIPTKPPPLVRLFILLTVIGLRLPHADAHELSFSSTVDYSSTQPSGGEASISNWTGAVFDAENIGGSGVNADGGADNGIANDSSTYVAGNQPRQGQTFTTGSNPNGYELKAVTARMAGYSNNNATGSNRTTWNLDAHNGPVQVEIGKANGTDVSTITKQLFIMGGTGTPGSGTSVNGAGTYLTFSLPFTTYLEPDTTYTFDFQVGNGSSNYFEWLGTQTDPYAGGTAYTRAWWGGPITPVAGERVFQLDLTALASPPATFAHPGALHTQADLDRMKAKVDAAEEPWKSSFDILSDSPWAQTWWPAYNIDYIVRGGSGNNYTRSQQDAQAIYELALRWHITGDTAFADHAVHIANTWSDLIGIQGDSNQSLAAGICGYLFACGGELLSTYPGWPEVKKQAYKDMMMRVFYPSNLDFLWRHHDTFWRNGGNTHYRLNWETANMASMAAIGILCDNHAVYEQAVDFFKHGPGNGRVERAAWYLFPDGTSQTEESGRDQAHNLGGWYAMALLCQMGWNQGDDLFGHDNNRVLRAFEYNAKYNLGNEVPWVFHRNTTLTYTEGLSGHVRGLGSYYQYELVHNHYANVKGIATPWSKLAVDATRPEPRPDTSVHPSQVDWFGLGSLTFARDPTAGGIAPSGLAANWSKNRIILNWWGTATATGYEIKRATSAAGPYTILGTVTGPHLNFADSSVSNDTTYHYKITAITPAGDLDSAPLRVARELVTHFSFDGSSDDGVGSRHGTRKGSTLPGYASGFSEGQALALNGGDQYLQLPAGSGSHEDITLAAWVRWNGGGTWQRVFDFGSEIEKYMMLTVNAGSNLLRFQMTTSRNTDGSLTITGPAMPTDTWTHVAVTLNGDTATMYVNGRPAGSATADRIDPLFAQPFCYLGKSMWNGDAYFNGRIDDFRIYNYGLSGNEVYSLWGQSSNNPPTFTSDPIVLTAADEDSDYSVAGETIASHASDTDGGGLVYVKVSGPAWLTVSGNGDLSGTPANEDVGDNIFVVRVTDPSGATDDANLFVPVNNTNDPPVWASDPIDGGVITSGDTHVFSIASHASDVDSGDSLSFTSISGPAWLDVAIDGTLSGSPAPADVGLNSFILRATDSAGGHGDVTFQIEVLPSFLLRSHYEFENDTTDATNGFDAVSTGSPTFVGGQVGQAIVLDGLDDLLTLPAGVANYQNITLATWVYWHGGGNWQRIFDFGNGANQYLFLTPEDGSGMRFTIKDGGSQHFVSTSTLPANQWTHVAVTLDGDTATLFVNGFPMASNTKVAINPSDFDPTINYIGDSQYPADPLFDGMIDDFRIYNYPLKADEVASLAGVATPPQGTVAHWDFEEGTADILVPGPASNGSYVGSMLDISGNGNHLSPWSEDTFHYRSIVPADSTPQNGAANTLSIQNSGSYPSATTVDTSINGWSPAEWTIEASIRPDSVSGHRTFIGRDSQNHAGTGGASVLYFQTRDSSLVIQYTDVAGNIWQLVSATGAITANQWHAVAATSDGSTLSLYRKNLTTGQASYELLGTLDISSSSHPALAIGTGDGGDWNAGEFSVGRGLYNGGHTDRFFGYLDNIRLSDVALSPGVFLHSNPPVPTELSATVVSDTAIDLSWTVSDSATGHIVKRSTSSGGPYATLVSDLLETTYTDTGLAAHTTYYYVVSTGGDGVDSEEVSATTESSPITAEEIRRSVLSFDNLDFTVGTADLEMTIGTSVSGHLYQIECSPDMSPESWENIGAAQAGTGGLLQFIVPISTASPAQFYRIRISR